MSEHNFGAKEELEIVVKELAEKVGLKPPYSFEELMDASYHYLYPNGVKSLPNRKERRRK